MQDNESRGSMKKYEIALACLMAVMGLGSDASADDMVRASCVMGTERLLQADLPADQAEAAKRDIIARYPKALCVFVKPSSSIENGALPSMSDAPDDLARALAYISPSGEIGKPYGKAFNDAMTSYSKTPNAFGGAKSGGSMNFTVGIYEGANQSEILQYWDYVKHDSKVLGRYTPTLQTAENVVIVSVENVPDADAAELCHEAEKFASGCVSAY